MGKLVGGLATLSPVVLLLLTRLLAQRAVAGAAVAT